MGPKGLQDQMDYLVWKCTCSSSTHQINSLALDEVAEVFMPLLLGAGGIFWGCLSVVFLRTHGRNGLQFVVSRDISMCVAMVTYHSPVHLSVIHFTLIIDHHRKVGPSFRIFVHWFQSMKMAKAILSHMWMGWITGGTAISPSNTRFVELFF